MSSKSNARLPADPLISIRIEFLRPDANRVASNVAKAPPVKRARKIAASSTVTSPRSAPPTPGKPAGGLRQRPFLDEGLQQRTHADDLLAGDVLREVDDVRPDVAQRARTGLVLLQPPGQRCFRIGDPVLQVLRPHVPDVADPAVDDQPARQRDGRNATVGEPHHRPHTHRAGRLRRRVSSLRLRRRCWPAASRTARACRRPALRWRSRRGYRQECRCRPARRRRARSAPASLSRRPASRSAPPRIAALSRLRPPRTANRGTSGRSKKLGALRQACE